MQLDLADLEFEDLKRIIVACLENRPNQSCKAEALTDTVLAHLGVKGLRGRKREEFTRRLNQAAGALKRARVVRQYQSKNVRIRLVQARVPTPQLRLGEALQQAAQLHHGAAAAGGGNSLGRALGTCALVLESSGSEEEAIAALLVVAYRDGQEALQDDDIRSRYGDRVLGLVRECVSALPGVATQSDGASRRRLGPDALGRLKRIGAEVAGIVVAHELQEARSALALARSHGAAAWLEKVEADGHPEDIPQQVLLYYEGLLRALRAVGASDIHVDELVQVAEDLRRWAYALPTEIIRELRA